MERPPDEEQPDEGRVLRFPGIWVPTDGIEPLNESPAETEASNGVGNGVDSPIGGPSQTERTAFEAGEFWERGDTQEFVGVAASQAHSTTASDDAAATMGVGDEGMSRLSLESRTTSHNGDGIAVGDVARDSGRPTSSARYAWAKLAGVAVLVLGALVGGGIALASALHSMPQPHREAAAPRSTQGTRLAATGALVLPAVNRRRPALTVTHRASTSTSHGSARSAQHTPAVTPVQPVRYVQPTPPTTASAPSASEASSSGGSSSGATAPPPAQAQTPQSVPHQAATPARPSPSGALTCISNCG